MVTKKKEKKKDKTYLHMLKPIKKINNFGNENIHHFKTLTPHLAPLKNKQTNKSIFIFILFRFLFKTKINKISLEIVKQISK